MNGTTAVFPSLTPSPAMGCPAADLPHKRALASTVPCLDACVRSSSLEDSGNGTATIIGIILLFLLFLLEVTVAVSPMPSAEPRRRSGHLNLAAKDTSDGRANVSLRLASRPAQDKNKKNNILTLIIARRAQHFCRRWRAARWVGVGRYSSGALMVGAVPRGPSISRGSLFRRVAVRDAD